MPKLPVADMVQSLTTPKKNKYLIYYYKKELAAYLVDASTQEPLLKLTLKLGQEDPWILMRKAAMFVESTVARAAELKALGFEVVTDLLEKKPVATRREPVERAKPKREELIKSWLTTSKRDS